MPENMSQKRATGADMRRREAQSKVIQDRITATEQQLGQLCDVSSSYTRKTARIRDKGDMMAKQLMEFSEVEKWNPSLTQGMVRFAENLSAVQDYRETQVKRLEKKVVSPLVNYGLLCKQTKNDLRLAFSHSDKEINQKKKLETIRSKNPNDHQKISQLEGELQRASLDASRSSKALETQVETFEANKLKDMKKIMREFVMIEMHFHAKALEMYTQCYQTLNEIDPEADIQEFRRQLQPDGSSIRSDIARSASQASLESRESAGSDTPRRHPARPNSTHNPSTTATTTSHNNNSFHNTNNNGHNVNANNTSSVNSRRKIPVPPIPTDDDDDEEEDSDDDDYDDSEDDYTETVTEPAPRKR